MGRTILPFRAALEREIESWKEFARGLRPEDRKAFSEIMDNARAHADAGSLSARPLLSEIIFMAQLVEQQKAIEELVKKVAELEKKLAQTDPRNF